MGLIKAALGAAGGVLADQWKEFFYCEAIDKDILVVKGQKMIGSRSSNTKGSDNIISNGSGICVADGQCMIIVDQGKVVEFCAEPGEFTYDTSSEPSIFAGSLGKSIIESFKTFGKRFAYGGDTGKDQRVYYFNTKEIIDNKVGTPSPVPFRVVDTNIGLDIDIRMRCNAVYSYKITDPLLFYTNVCGNVTNTYDRSEIDAQLKSELLAALQPAFSKISDQGIRYSSIAGHTLELEKALREVLVEKWTNNRGITLHTFNINSINADPQDEEMIRQAQRNAIYRDPTMAAATLVGAQSQAMQDAAKNSAGAMTGFMGMGMAAQAGGVNAQNLFAMGQQQQAAAPAPAAPAAGSWTCQCGTVNTGKFCSNCGTPAPAPAGNWTCKCGTVNTGKFCSNCGSPRA
ncbi:MAG: SPFH domain-containing protein [Lachnospiraceae bacterium]|nr:SPFH domain-containing protein [Lachnospiraceae bacterium]MBQ6089824.1 SPFH domain-containing protein [Lachnospiraceae bacterium]